MMPSGDSAPASADLVERAREMIDEACGEVVDYVHGSETMVHWRVRARLAAKIATEFATIAEEAAKIASFHLSAAPQSGWRPIEEAFPEHEPIWIANAETGDVSKYNGSHDGVSYIPVTHWMPRQKKPAPPLPAPPTEDAP